MKTVKGMPITASRTSMSKKRPFVPNAKDTSADAQSMIQEPPAPFKNRLTTAQMATKAPGASGGISTTGAKIQSGLARKQLSSTSLPHGAAVGQRRPINQSGQVNGRMGTKFPRKVGGGDLTSKFPGKRNASFYGE